MFATDKGIPFPSRPITFTDGARVSVDLSFLHSPMQRMQAPVVRELWFHFNGDISGVTATFDNKDSCQIFNSIQMRDKGGVFYDLPGKLARLDAQMELGSAADEHDGLTDAASGATTSDDDMILRIPFDLQFARNGSDTALELIRLTEGGRIDLTLGTPAGAAGVSGTITCYALIHDEKRRELKSRLVRTHQTVSQKKDHYPIGGSLRALVLTSNPSTAGYSPWTASTYEALNVPELELSSFSTYILREEYKRLRSRLPRSADDVITGGYGVPLVVPSSGQRVDKMPDLRSITIDLGSSTIPTSAELFISAIEDRDPVLSAQWLGYGDVPSFMAAVRERGHVALAGGKRAKATEFNPAAARRLPMVLE